MIFSKVHIQKLESYLGVKTKPGEYEKKLLEKVAKYTSMFRYIPGIQCICICNSLAMNACHENSDIDLFIITQKNRLWTARVFTTLLLTILGQRKTSKHHAGKFCLSFFISEEDLKLEDIAIKNDMYLSYWAATLKPLINRNKTFERFMKANKTLSHQTIQSGIVSPQGTSILNPFPSEEKGAIQDGISSLLQERIERGVLWKSGNLLELLLRKIFLTRTKKSFQKLGKPFGVTISDTMLKFHDKDRRKEIRDSII